MSFKYESSQVFADLKNIKERISGNLTTYQYLISYDQMLDNALLPVVRDTKFLDCFLMRVLGWQEKNFRRKVSFLPKKDVPRRVLNFFLARTTEERMTALINLRLDRGLRIEALEIFFRTLSDYEKACNLELTTGDGSDPLELCLHVKTETEKSLGTEAASLLPALRESRYWLAVASGFKQKLMEKYIRLCLVTAQRDYTGFFDCSVKLDDLIQTYLMAASRAIDKCDYKQGVLTSHIQNWLFTAREAMSKTRERNMDSFELTCLSDLDPMSSSFQESSILDKDTVNVIAQLAKIVDPVGAARCYLQLPEPSSIFSNHG